MSPPSKTSYWLTTSFVQEFLIRTTNSELFPIEIKPLAVALVSKYQNQNFFKPAAPSQRLFKTALLGKMFKYTLLIKLQHFLMF
jgi:hypothetical protein